jgi:hypothetical protein
MPEVREALRRRLAGGRPQSCDRGDSADGPASKTPASTIAGSSDSASPLPSHRFGLELLHDPEEAEVE